MCKNKVNERIISDDHFFLQKNTDILSRKEKSIRFIFFALGVLILGYIYTESLWAQQRMQQRISIIQATDFPRDI